MIPCQHTTTVPGCRVCHLFATDPRYRKLWGGDPREATKAGALVTIPDVPAFDLKPTKSRAVVTVAVGQHGAEMLAISGPLLKAYAERCNADYVVLTWPGHPAWPISAKFALTRILEHYDRVCYLDADVVVRPSAVNLFEQCRPGELGAFNDWPIVLSKSPWFAGEFVKFRETMGLKTGVLHPIPWYVNTGVMVFDRFHRDVFTVPDRPIPATHCGEQHWWVSRMIDLGTRVKLLPAVCNWQYWATDAFSTPIPDDAILHFSGMAKPGHAERIRLMNQYAGGATIRQSLTVDRTRPCVNGTVILPRSSSCWRLCPRTCEAGHGTVQHAVQCQRCGDYQPGGES